MDRNILILVESERKIGGKRGFLAMQNSESMSKRDFVIFYKFTLKLQ